MADPSSAKPRALVTGGAGFIGSHLVDRLRRGRARGRGDRQFRDRPARQSGASCRQSARDRSRGDITDGRRAHRRHRSGELGVSPRGARGHRAVDRAADRLSSARMSTATFNVLEAARAAGVKRFVYAASSSCYGIPDIYPTPETAEIRPQYPYALTKYLGEQCVMHWGKVYKLPAVSLRLFNVFGPRHRTTGTYGAVFGVFLAQKLAGKPFTIVGDGEQTRDFTFVTDVADAFVTAARSRSLRRDHSMSAPTTPTASTGCRAARRRQGAHPEASGRARLHLCRHLARSSACCGWHPKIRFEDGVASCCSIDQWRDAIWTWTDCRCTKDWFRYWRSRKRPPIRFKVP